MVDLADLISSILLGIVEGITEFLPISSTGHLIVASELLNFERNANGTFEIFIQLGAILAVVVFYRATLINQARRVTGDKQVQHFWLALIIATIPAALIGFALRSFIKETLFNPIVVAASLIIGGLVLIVIERRTVQPPSEPAPLEAVTFRQALLIGFAQVIALIPGVSRSAASIVGGMFVGLPRRTATEFSFFLAIPTLGGATLLDLVLSLDEIQSDEWVYLIVGLVVAFFVALVVIQWLLRYVTQHDFRAFGVYRIAIGILILILVGIQVL